MEHGQTSGETLMAICAESPGRFGIYPESGEPLEGYLYSELTLLGYTSDALESSGDKDGNSINDLYKLIYPNRVRGERLGEMRPECLKLADTIQKFKLKQSVLAAEIIIGVEAGCGYSLSVIRRGIGEFGRKSLEGSAPGDHKPNVWLWERVADQVARNSLEWLPWGGGGWGWGVPEYE